MSRPLFNQTGAATLWIIIGVMSIAIIAGFIFFAGDDTTSPNTNTTNASNVPSANTSNANTPSALNSSNANAMSAASSYAGQVIAGSSAPLLDFNQADYAAALQTDKLVVIYFYANWCPICQEETANALYPAFNELTRDDVIGFRVNYNDNQTDEAEESLAREFGIAYQHSKVFVQNGQRVLKAPDSWNKERYLSEIASLTN